MSNQFEVLRLKNGMTTTVINITKKITTANSTKNDEMDWKFINVTSSTAKMVKKCKEKKPGFSSHYKKIKINYFRCGIVGHKINKCNFLFARRPVATIIITTTTIPKTTVTNWFREVKA